MKGSTRLNDESCRFALLEECVRRSFHPAQLVDAPIAVSVEKIHQIARAIWAHVQPGGSHAGAGP